MWKFLIVTEKKGYNKYSLTFLPCNEPPAATYNMPCKTFLPCNGPPAATYNMPCNLLSLLPIVIYLQGEVLSPYMYMG